MTFKDAESPSQSQLSDGSQRGGNQPEPEKELESTIFDSTLKFPCTFSPKVNLKYSTPFSLSPERRFPVRSTFSEDDALNSGSTSKFPAVVINKNITKGTINLHKKINSKFNTDYCQNSNSPRVSENSSKPQTALNVANTEYVFDAWEQPVFIWNISGLPTTCRHIVKGSPLELSKLCLTRLEDKNMFKISTSCTNSHAERCDDIIFATESETSRFTKSRQASMDRKIPACCRSQSADPSRDFIYRDDKRPFKNLNNSRSNKNRFKSTKNIPEPAQYITCANPYCRRIFSPYESNQVFYENKPQFGVKKKHCRCKNSRNRVSRCCKQFSQQTSDDIAEFPETVPWKIANENKSNISMQNSDQYEFDEIRRHAFIVPNNCNTKMEAKFHSGILEKPLYYHHDYNMPNLTADYQIDKISSENDKQARINASSTSDLQTNGSNQVADDVLENIAPVQLKDADLKKISTKEEGNKSNFTSEYVRKLNRKYMKLAPCFIIKSHTSTDVVDADQTNDTENSNTSRLTVTVPNSSRTFENSTEKNTLAETEATYLESSSALENDLDNDTAIRSEEISSGDNTFYAS